MNHKAKTQNHIVGSSVALLNTQLVMAHQTPHSWLMAHTVTWLKSTCLSDGKHCLSRASTPAAAPMWNGVGCSYVDHQCVNGRSTFWYKLPRCSYTVYTQGCIHLHSETQNNTSRTFLNAVQLQQYLITGKPCLQPSLRPHQTLRPY